MDNENVAHAWDLLYQYMSSEISTDNFSQYSQSSITSNYIPNSQQHDSSKNLITLFPDMIMEMILQSGSEQDVEKIFLKLMEDPGPCSNKSTMIMNLATSVEKLCPEVKPVAQELLMLLNRVTNKAHGNMDLKSMGNDVQLFKCIQKFCFFAARALPLPLSSEASASHVDVDDENMGIQDLVLQRLKAEVLPEEIPEILKTIKNDDTPMGIMGAPISEDFVAASFNEASASHVDDENIGIQDLVLQRLKVEILSEEVPEILKTIKNDDDTPMHIMDAPISEDFDAASSNEKTSHSNIESKCTICGRVFGSDVKLLRHIQNFHKNVKKLYSCDMCNRRFFYQHELQCHIENHSKEKSNNFCAICNRQFDSQHSFEKHSLCHGPNSNEANFRCRFCEKKFLLKLQKDKHENRHIIGADMDMSLNWSESSTILSQFEESLKQKNYSGCSSYLLSPDCSWCYNFSTKGIQRVADVTRQCSVLLDTKLRKQTCLK